MNYLDEYNRWLNSSFTDDKTKEELRTIKDEEEIKDRFYKSLEFGTAGLRGIIGAGTNRMNIYTVSKTAFAIGQVILKKNLKEKGIVIARDVRHKSEEFERTSAEIFANLGIKTYVFDSIRPTPMLAYAVRYLKTAAGVMVTASHNPKVYNGYKVYGPKGSQILTDEADEILQEIEKIDYTDIERLDYNEALKKGLICQVDKEFDESYYKKVLDLKIYEGEDIDKDIKIIYTPLNGCGNIPVRHILKERGFKNVTVVKEQENPDPDFKTVSFPNPEFIEVFDIGKKYANKVDADIIIATDPDSDRLRVLGRREKGDYYGFSGNELSYLLVDYILKGLKSKNILSQNGAMVRSIVSSDLIEDIGKAYNIKCFESLTGFKNICNYANIWEKTDEYKFVFGYEESIGYVVTDFVRDKDGVQIAMLVAEMAAFYKKNSISLYDKLQEIFKEYGYVSEFLTSIVLEGQKGAERIKRMMDKFRNENISEFGGIRCKEKIDFINGYKDVGPSNVLKFILNDKSWFSLRPSGTEPKIKLYIYTKDKDKNIGDKKINDLKKDILQKLENIKWGALNDIILWFQP